MKNCEEQSIRVQEVMIKAMTTYLKDFRMKLRAPEFSLKVPQKTSSRPIEHSMRDTVKLKRMNNYDEEGFYA